MAEALAIFTGLLICGLGFIGSRWTKWEDHDNGAGVSVSLGDIDLGD